MWLLGGPAAFDIDDRTTVGWNVKLRSDPLQCVASLLSKSPSYNKPLNNRGRTMSEKQPECHCHQCIEDNDIRDEFSKMPLSAMRMILCKLCDNKRCPHASDHRNACTGSNEPGQPGSVYAPPAQSHGGA